MKPIDFRPRQKWRVVKEGASLQGMQPIAPFAQTRWSMPLPVGTVLTCSGVAQSFGDGVPLVTWRDAEDRFLANDCEFKPSVGGMWSQAPKDGYLELIDSGLTDIRELSRWSWLELRSAVQAYGYRFGNWETFVRDADPALVDRAHAHREIGHPNFVIWDPNDDREGWLLVGSREAELLRETAEMIAGSAEEGPLAIRSKSP